MWPVIFTQQLLYRVRFLGRRVDEISRLVRAIFFGMLATAADLGVREGRDRPFVADPGRHGRAPGRPRLSERLIARSLFDRARQRGTLLRPVLIAGRNAEGRLVREVIESNPALGYRFEGFIEDLLQARTG